MSNMSIYSHGAVGKSSLNPLPSPLLCEISKALHLAQLGLSAGRQADEIQVNLENLRIC